MTAMDGGNVNRLQEQSLPMTFVEVGQVDTLCLLLNKISIIRPSGGIVLNIFNYF